MTFTERVFAVMDALKKAGKLKSDRQFALKLGIDPSQLSAARRGKREVPDKYLYYIAEFYNVSIDFLKGKGGEIFTNVNAEAAPKPEAKPVYQDVFQVPIVEKRARAGYQAGYADPEYVEKLRKIFVPRQYEKGNYLVFEIDGNSMDDGSRRSICNGDAILCKELDRVFWREKLFFNKYLYIIVTADDVVCKQITHHNVETGEIHCHSFNEAYEDFDLNLKDVYQLFYLVKIVERDLNF
jgi:transcriptional regulator with XRE-family HTH domain